MSFWEHVLVGLMPFQHDEIPSKKKKWWNDLKKNKIWMDDIVTIKAHRVENNHTRVGHTKET